MVQDCNRNGMNCDLVSVLVKSETGLKRRDRLWWRDRSYGSACIARSGGGDEERRLHNWFL